MSLLCKRLPDKQKILNVYGGVVFFVFSWSIRGYLYNVPSYLLSFPLGEVLSIFCYMLAFSLLESMLVISGLVLLAMVLPRKWFIAGFEYKGFLVVLVMTVSMILLQGFLTNRMPPMDIIYGGVVISVSVIVILFFLFDYVSALRKALLVIQDRMRIFIYLYVPLGILGILVVISRNIF